MKIEIDSYWELLALHKSLMAVKFDENSCLREAQGSPYTGSLAFKVFDLLVSASDKKQAEDWLLWQVADESRLETKLLLKHIASAAWWKEADCIARENYVSHFMAPLKLSPELTNQYIKNC